jgi:multiple sugar transport system permease protein
MPTYGGLNQALRALGVPEIPWLTASSLALPTVTGVVVWEWTPFVILLLVASLQSLPQEPFEAAQVDGANTWQVFRHITLPLLSPAILFVAIFRIIESLKVFPVIYVLTGGGPGTTTEPINYYAYLLGFSYSRVGEAATVIVMIFLFVLVMSLFMIAWRANPAEGA